ncbi:O-antigen ligase family protein [Phenylobacterium sp.]|uniref:O-antigen ligase family protein n=1 Tax=Phenylobacterium sp. TaxID=1871053 RepID=UPI0035B28CDC
MIQTPAAGRGAVWLGGVLVLLFSLTPLVAWLGPLGFAPLAAVCGLAAIWNLRIGEADRPAAIAILVMVCWAVVSVVWSPYQPAKLGASTAAKLVAEAVLYWAMFRAAASAAPASRALALKVLAWGLAAYGVLLVVEAASGALIYRSLRQAIGDPIRPDLAIKNVAQGSFVLAVLAPAGALAGWRAGAGVWPGLLIGAGVVAATLGLAADAPTLALVAGFLAGAAAYAWPKAAPRLLAACAAVYFLAMPWVLAAGWKSGLLQQVETRVELSWSMRLGYWRHAVDWTRDHPFRGWGLDASRMFGPGITLHPHNGALQVWLELGLIGAMAAAVFFAVAMARQARARRDLGAAAAVAAASAYLVMGAVSFGVWQEWWLAVGALAATACLALQRPGVAERP